MDKFRALTVYAKSLVRHMQGSGELIDTHHIFYEAYRIIKKNSWEKEAYKFLEEEISNISKRDYNIIVDYAEYLESGEKDEIKETYFNIRFHKFGIDGRTEEVIKYYAENGEYPSLDFLNDVMEKRKEEDNKNKDIFFENQIKIALNEDFNKEALLEASKKLMEHGLYETVLRALPYVINSAKAEKEMKGYDAMFRFKLY